LRDAVLLLLRVTREKVPKRG